jgi:hypothetical protein
MEPAKVLVAAVPVVLAMTLLAGSTASVALTCAEADSGLGRQMLASMLSVELRMSVASGRPPTEWPARAARAG